MTSNKKRMHGNSSLLRRASLYIKRYDINTLTTKLNVITAIYGALDEMITKPTPCNIVKNVSTIAVNALGFINDADLCVFPPEEWSQPFSSYFNRVIFEAFKHDDREIVQVHKMFRSEIVDVGNARIGFSHGISNGFTDGDAPSVALDANVYVEMKNYDEAIAAIRDRLWSMHRSNVIEMVEETMIGHRCGERIKFIDNNLHVPIQSEKALSMARYLQRCFDAGVNRSLFIYGPPGSGKSTIAVTIIDELKKLRTLTVNSSMFDHEHSLAVIDAVKTYKPDAVIIDDFDRASDQSSLLSLLEHLRKNAKLVIATANSRVGIDEAVLRPGRFDELIFVKHLDEAVIRHVLGSENEDAFEMVKGWPIAFIHEFVQRRKFLSVDDALKAVMELRSRVARLSTYDDEGDDEEEKDDVCLPVSKKKGTKKTKIALKQRSAGCTTLVPVNS